MAKKQSIRCKPGDRARIIASEYFQENIGKTVVVVRKYIPGESVSGCCDWIFEGTGWVVTALWGSISNVSRSGQVFQSMTVVICDKRLQPLKDNEGGIEGYTVLINQMSIKDGVQ